MFFSFFSLKNQIWEANNQISDDSIRFGIGHEVIGSRCIEVQVASKFQPSAAENSTDQNQTTGVKKMLRFQKRPISRQPESSPSSRSTFLRQGWSNSTSPTIRRKGLVVHYLSFYLDSSFEFQDVHNTVWAHFP